MDRGIPHQHRRQARECPEEILLYILQHVVLLTPDVAEHACSAHILLQEEPRSLQLVPFAMFERRYTASSASGRNCCRTAGKIVPLSPLHHRVHNREGVEDYFPRVQLFRCIRRKYGLEQLHRNVELPLSVRILAEHVVRHHNSVQEKMCR